MAEEEIAAAVPSPLRGRALLKACTAPSLVERSAEGDLASAKALALRRTTTATGVRTGCRASSSGKQRSPLALEHLQEGEERGSSVPAVRGRLPAQAEEASQSPQHIPQRASRKLSKEIREGVKLVKKVLERDVRRQLRVVVGGLMGSGKSTLCRMLAHLLDGVWVNQDEFSHKGKGAKKAFLSEIRNLAKDRKTPVLIIDKINTMRKHRQDIMGALRSGAIGDTVFVQIVHPNDPPGRLDHQIELCRSRIQSRGEGHRTLMASDPKLESILRMTASGIEPMQEAELELFSAHLTVDMILPPTQGVMQLLSLLDAEGFLGRFHVEDLLTEERLSEALEVTQAAEEQLGAKGGEPAKAAKKKRPLWISTVELDEISQASVQGLWSTWADSAPSLRVQEAFHVTLLHWGGKSDKELCVKYPHLQGPEEVARLRETLAGREGDELEFHVTALVWDERIAAGEVAGADGLCANVHPHATVAMKDGVAPVMSNELLARRAANQDFKEGLAPWLAQLGLSKYREPLEDWCSSSGTSTADDLVANAVEVALALEPEDVDQRARIRTTLAQAAPGKVGEALVEPALVLHGRIRNRRRGE